MRTRAGGARAVGGRTGDAGGPSAEATCLAVAGRARCRGALASEDAGAAAKVSSRASKPLPPPLPPSGLPRLALEAEPVRSLALRSDSRPVRGGAIAESPTPPPPSSSSKLPPPRVPPRKPPREREPPPPPPPKLPPPTGTSSHDGAASTAGASRRPPP